MLKKIFMLLAFPLSIFCYEQDVLSREDIHKVMEQIFSQHVDQKNMNQQILTNSFKVYLDQFDPEKIYLLKSDAAPFLNIDPKKAAEFIEQYKRDDYTAYEQINQMIQKAVGRARVIRKKIMQDPKSLSDSAMNSPSQLLSTPESYAADEKELEKRIRNHLIGFLQLEIKQYGPKKINGLETKALALYEKQLQNYEDNYIFTNNTGTLSSDEKENLFTLHILKAIAKSLDAHTAFLDKEEAYDMRIRLEKGFEGIGIAFQPAPTGAMVATIIKDGPADREGQVKVGDLLVEINGTSVNRLPFEKIMGLLKGDKNSPIHLIFTRSSGKEGKSKTIDVTLKRDTIVLNEDRVDVTSEKFGDGIIGKITLHSFYQNDRGITSEKDVRDAIGRLKQQGVLRGLILDLRENSGGFLSQAVKVAGLFITNGVVVISKYSNGTEKIYRDMDTKVDYNGPLIVLTSRATASAAEIVAQALQDYGVALVVGDEQTYGKGTIQSQTVTNNNGGSFFKVTVGTYYTVSGKTPQINGVKADVIVPGPYSKVHLGEEYLNHTVSNQNQIPPTFDDPLKDIDPGVKPWYLRYYMPTLQHKNLVWREEIAQLKKNSEERLSKNKNYQAFLSLLNHKETETLKEELSEENSKEKNFGTDDLQMAEALNVMKDMIHLAPQVRVKEYMVGVDHPQNTQEAAAH